MNFEPHNYQRIAMQKILDLPAVGLFLEMGMGKTVSVLTAVSELLKNKMVKRVLVIAPLRVAEDTWSSEVDKWNHLQGLIISKVLGSQQKRIAALNCTADIYIINRENVEWLVKYFGNEWNFDMVVIDELSSFKSHSSLRFKALRRVRKFIKRIVGLTGTPTPNSLIDLWAQLHLLDRGERLGKSLTEYRTKYFKAGRRNGNIIFEWLLQDGAEKRILNKIADICVSMSTVDWLEMPERIDNIVPVKLADGVRRKYHQLERCFLMEMADTNIIASNAAVLSGKLLQMANGAIYDENKDVQEIHSAKLDALADIIGDATGPVLVFYAYKHDKDRIMKRIKGVKELQTADDIKKWNSGQVPVMLAHPSSAGHGLNLQAGGNTIVWFGLTWSLEQYQQANARLHRQGQQRGVIIHHIVAVGTIDEDVMAALQQKNAGQKTLMRILKAKLEDVERLKGAG